MYPEKKGGVGGVGWGEEKGNTGEERRDPNTVTAKEMKVMWKGEGNIQICQILLKRWKLWSVLGIHWDRMEISSAFSESNTLECSLLGQSNGTDLSKSLPVLFPLISMRCKHTRLNSWKCMKYCSVSDFMASVPVSLEYPIFQIFNFPHYKE